MCKINGKKVVELRTAKKMTQKELAKKAGLSPWSICQVETGKTNANDESLAKIANALGVNRVVIMNRQHGYFLTTENVGLL